MKLPWDKNYLKISFHVIITILAIYAIGLVISNFGNAFLVVRNFFSSFVGIIGPLVVALVFSYLANPAVEFLQNKGEKFLHVQLRRPHRQENPYYKKRLMGTLLTYIIIFALIFIAGQGMAKKIGSADATELAESLNNYIQGFSDLLVLLKVRLAEVGILKNVDGFLDGGIQTLTEFFKNSIMNVANSVSRAGGWVINLGIGMTAAFYLLMEKERILFYCNDILDVFLVERWSKRVKGICRDVNNVFSGYIGGQVTDAIIMAILISVTFSFLGIKYPIMIGIISGFSNLIPYVGAIVAFVLSVSMGLLSGTPVKALYAAIAVLILQQIDGMFIVPRVVGKSVELHPVLVLLSLSIFGSVFGLLGMVVAVPCTAIIKLFLSRLYERKRAEQQNGSGL